MEKKGTGKLLLGVAIGAGLGVLFAPKKGKDTRKLLKEKMHDLVSSAKELSISDVSSMIEDKIQEIRCDLNDLDKEKVLKIAKEKSRDIKKKLEDLVDLAIQKGTPVLKDKAIDVRDKTMDVMDDMIKKLESNEKEYVGRSAMTRYLLIVGINIPATNIKKRGISKLLHVNFFKYTFITGNNVYINTSIFVYQNDPNSFLFI